MIAFDRCPICHRSFEDCPHSVTDVTERKRQEAIRKIVRDELKRTRSSGQEGRDGER